MEIDTWNFCHDGFRYGSLSAIISYRIERAPFCYFSVILGGTALLDLFLYYIMGETSPFAYFSFGGLERWIAYPVLLWVIGFGGYLMGDSQS